MGSSDATEAITRLIDEHGGLIHALGLRFCGNRADADDLVQEVFLEAFKGWSGFRGESDVRTWLYTIAVRACRRLHRPRAGAPESIGSLDDLLPFGAPRIAMLPDDLDDAASQAMRREATARIEEAIAALPEEFRIPLVLKEIVGCSVPEIARILGLEEGTARSRVHRARLRLRDAVDRTIPRAPGDAPPPAYPRQTCLDLLQAKQEALDRGVPFDSTVVCDRCRSVFASLDLTTDLCRDLSAGRLPPGVRERLLGVVESA
ncbi:MAG: sigma-70 family RNA polymerase sigma factor [Phycisphaerales bacterium]|nr:sigma-70 family RNA polymerase sigma factor [Phycisphaerales bacterium]